MPFVQASDVRLHYVQHGNGAEPLVFIHGYTGGLRDWEDVLPRLPATMRGYAFDLRGAGESDKPGHGYSIQQYAEDIAVATRALAIDTFTLIGHSMGGGVAMQFAVSFPERLRRLVLVAPVSSDGVQAMDPAVREQLKAVRRNRELAKAMAKAFMVRTRSDAQIERSIENNLRWEDDAYDAAYESMRDLGLSDRVAALMLPVLMIAGDRDFLRAANLEDAQRIPGCALQVFYRVGHLIQSDVPDQFVETLVDFIEHGAAAPVTAADRIKFLEAMRERAAW